MVIKWLRKVMPNRMYQRRQYQRIDTSAVMKEKLSIIYALFAFGSFIAVTVTMLNGKRDWADYYGLKTDEEKAMPSGQLWAKTLGIENVKIITVQGFKKVNEYEIENSNVKVSDS